MRTPGDDKQRLQIANLAYDLIDNEVRPFLDTGGLLWSKGSRGYPSRLRRMLAPLDSAHSVTYTTVDAMRVEREERVVEHVVPMKRIVIELVDPNQADPRSNQTTAAIAGGPATSPEHLIVLFDKLVVKCWVTAEEHNLLNRTARSFQWDAPGGDGWARYRAAGVTAYPLDRNGQPVR